MPFACRADLPSAGLPPSLGHHRAPGASRSARLVSPPACLGLRRPLSPPGTPLLASLADPGMARSRSGMPLPVRAATLIRLRRRLVLPRRKLLQRRSRQAIRVRGLSPARDSLSLYRHFLLGG